jgi:hypothetical protein
MIYFLFFLSVFCTLYMIIKMDLIHFFHMLTHIFHVCENDVIYIHQNMVKFLSAKLMHFIELPLIFWKIIL